MNFQKGSNLIVTENCITLSKRKNNHYSKDSLRQNALSHRHVLRTEREQEEKEKEKLI
jgi:hypothetical protein